MLPISPMSPSRHCQHFALALLISGITALPAGAQAQDWDKQSFWYGFLLGSGTTVCELLKIGLLSQNDAKDWLQTMFQNDPDIPAVSLKSAREELRSNTDLGKCPVPR
ncbi:MAG: DUF308 domain-containing protein [Cyanobacteriota bacterium]|nr:DUF308 domain-containing protein [Cyanobacteriota bacterium]